MRWTRYSDPYQTLDPTRRAQPGAADVVEEGGLWAISGVRAGPLSLAPAISADPRWILGVRGANVALYTTRGLQIWDTSKPAKLAEANLGGADVMSRVLLGEGRAHVALGEWGLANVTY